MGNARTARPRRSIKVAIIGGGVIGLSLAWRLLERGASVDVFDAGRPTASQAAAGMLSPSFELGRGITGQALYALCRESLGAWPAFGARLEEVSGHGIDLQMRGALGVALDESQAMALASRAEALDADGQSAAYLSRGEAQSLEPSLGPGVVAALYCQGDGQVDPRRLLLSLRRGVERAGGRVHDAGDIDAVAPLAGGISLRGKGSTGGAKVWEGDCAVLATGAALGAAGIMTPLRPVKGEALALRAGRSTPRLVVRGEDVYLCPKADGRIIVGATEIDGADDLQPAPAAIAALTARARGLCPGIGEGGEIERWAGLRPATPDGAPILGRIPGGPEGLFLALGHYRNGILLAPATAQRLADLIVGGGDPKGLDPFSLARFNPKGCASRADPPLGGF